MKRNSEASRNGGTSQLTQALAHYGSCHPISDAAAFSRRHFIGLVGMAAAAVATGTELGLVSGPMKFAYAADGSEGDTPFSIQVVGKDEYGIVVRDFDTKALLEGAKVTIQSWYNDKTVSGVTAFDKDDRTKCFVIFNITELCENPSHNYGHYDFWGKLTIEKEGYRIFETGMMRMRGANHAEVGTKKLDGKPYLRCMTFNDFDIQYQAKNEVFTLADTNKEKHTLSFRVAAADGTKVTVWYYYNGTQWDNKTATASGGFADIGFVYDFLNDENAVWKFREGGKLTAYVRAGDVDFQLTARMTTKKAVMLANKNGDIGLCPGFMTSYIRPEGEDPITQDQLMQEMRDDGEEPPLPGLSITLPPKIPGIGGSKIDIKTPEFAVKYDFDPMGLAMIGVGIGASRKAKKGDKMGDVRNLKWKMDTHKSANEQGEEMAGDWLKAFDDYLANTRHPDPNNPNVNRFNKASAWNLVWKLSLQFSATACLTAHWDPEKLRDREWWGELKGALGLTFKFDWSQQYALGPVPAFLAIDFSAGAELAGSLAVEFTGFFRNVGWKAGTTGFGVFVKIALGVSIGVGWAGVASIGVRGGGYLSPLIGFFLPPKDGLPQPHLCLGAGAGIDFVVQIFCAKWTGRIVGIDRPALLDNWHGAKSDAAPDDDGIYWDCDPNDPAFDDYSENVPYRAEFMQADGSYTLPDQVVINNGVPMDSGDSLSAQLGYSGIMPSFLGDETAAENDPTADPQGFVLIKSDELKATCEMRGRANSSYAPAAVEGDATTVTDATAVQGATAGSGIAVESATAPEGDVATAGGSNALSPTDTGDAVLTSADDSGAPLDGAFAVGAEEFVWDYEPLSSDCGYVDVEYGENQIGIAAVTELGVKPSNETRILQNVFSDPRVKIVGYGGKLYMFRILIVEYPSDNNRLDKTQYRSRLSVAEYSTSEKKWGQSHVLEFGIGSNQYPTVSRRDFYDYEFDAAPHEKGIYLFLTCGTRPSGDLSTLRQVENHMIVVALDFNGTNVHFAPSFFQFYENNPGQTGNRLLIAPRVLVRPDGCKTCTALRYTRDASGKSDVKLVAVNYSSVNNPQPGLVDGKMFEWSIRAAYSDDSSIPISCTLSHIASHPMGERKTAAAIMFSSGGVGPYCQFTAFVAFDLGYNGTNLEPKVFFPIRGEQYFEILSATRAWPGRGLFVYCYEGKLIACHCSGSGGKLTTYDIGPAGVHIGDFVFAENGNVLYYTKINDGPQGDIIDQKTGERTKDETKLYQIWGCRSFKQPDGTERFCDPYPFGELAHPADSLEEATFNGHSAFMFRSIVEMKSSKTDLYFAAIPHVVSITLEKLASAEVLVDAGSKAKMLVFVRNVGNIAVQSFKVEVYEKGSKTLVDTIDIQCKDSTSMYAPSEGEDPLGIADPEGLAALVASGMTTQDANDKVDEATRAGVLLPGKARSYIGAMKIPDNWRGKKQLVAVVKGGSVDPCKLPGWEMPDDVLASAIPYTLPEDQWSGSGFETNDVEVVDLKDYDTDDNPYEWGTNPDDPHVKKTLAKTGDASIPLTGALGALGAGAAAFAAYSARRAKLKGGQEHDAIDES